MLKRISGVLGSLAMAAGVYLAATVGASSLAATFTTTERASHARNAGFTAGAKRVSAESWEEHAKCELMAERRKRACHALARGE